MALGNLDQSAPTRETGLLILSSLKQAGLRFWVKSNTHFNIATSIDNEPRSKLPVGCSDGSF